jgi:hypothetical protein
MLYTFLDTKRLELIDRCKVKALRRPGAAAAQLQHGIPQFLDQLIRTLKMEAATEEGNSDRLSGISGAWRPIRSDLGEAAALHGREMLDAGYSVDEVVHAYGDLCQAITELAYEQHVAIDVDEFHTVNRCLDNAIADAVKEYAYGRKILAEDKALALNERYGSFIHELRNHIGTATLAFALVRDGRVTANGATGAIVERTHSAMAELIERSITETRTRASIRSENKLVSLSGFIAETYTAASLQAELRGCNLVAAEVDPTLAVDVDTVLLSGAVMNLLTNAFKFTYHATTVCLDAYATADRILISVSDHCGGIPPELVDTMFLPFAQGSADHSGLGLGLSISRKYVEACHGTLTCRNMPGEGCVFTIDLPRRLLQPALAAAPV